ncbi:hypothetical protein MPSEU_000594900 [Mayamaea pseudoterrestris]|nr:hypothetical protein MPSEU_000594900 [Mayamaea pseudoterrestris]
MSIAEDASSALPPMGHDDDLDAVPEDDAVAFAVAAVQHGEGMLDDDVLNQNDHVAQHDTQQLHGVNFENHESVITEQPLDPSASIAAAAATMNNNQNQSQQLLSPSKLNLGTAIVQNKTQPTTSKGRTRRVGRTDRQRHEELIEAAAKAVLSGADDSLAIEIAGAGVIYSKHDEKWNAMFQKLADYQKKHGHTLVPQCYHDDPRLGRWVHYQRVEYWLFQASGTGKITPERIKRLNDIEFEWDPQREKWNSNFDKLVLFHRDHAHCRVPKNWSQDPELANWVRNQRLEYSVRQKKGRKSRMTQERLDKLNNLGFTWSNSTSTATASTAEAGTTTEQPRKRLKQELELEHVKKNELADNVAAEFVDCPDFQL